MADLQALLKDDMTETAFNVITKSGSTAETMSQFLHVRELLDGADGCDPRRQIVLTTDPDPEKSLLRRIGARDGYSMLSIPSNVGGRFSVLSSVGLLTAAVGGVDIDDLLLGAAAMDSQCQNDNIWENPAALYATLLYRFYQRKKPISVLMPYSQRLKALAFWYCQLWAESLGKKDGLTQNNVFQGPTPVPSVGVTDQHSVMQLYQDGPFDKVITFIEVEKPHTEDITICQGKVEEDVQYLSGRTFNDLFSAELQATRFALRDKKRPNCTIKIPYVNARTLGQLFMFFEYAVTFSGYLYDVNAFDQPGVELGKRYTYGLLGRKGYEPPKM
jgi:glucose-6-phosphate isomerase